MDTSQILLRMEKHNYKVDMFLCFVFVRTETVKDRMIIL